MSPLPSSFSAPIPVDKRPPVMFGGTARAMRGRELFLTVPVMTSTEGRCVARIEMNAYGPSLLGQRAISSSISLAETIIRSANSSIMITM